MVQLIISLGKHEEQKYLAKAGFFRSLEFRKLLSLPTEVLSNRQLASVSNCCTVKYCSDDTFKFKQAYYWALSVYQQLASKCEGVS